MAVAGSVKSIGTNELETNAVTNPKILDETIEDSKLTNPKCTHNFIHNGDMRIAQRSTSVSGITGVGYQTIDNYYLQLNNLGTWTMSQETLTSSDAPYQNGFTKALKLDCTTADSSPAAGDNFSVNIKFEGQKIQYWAKGSSGAKSLTLSFWVKATKTGTYIAQLRDQENSSRFNSKAYTVNSSDTWEYKTITFAGDTTGTISNDNTLRLELMMGLGYGSDFTSGTLPSEWAAYTAANTAAGQVNAADSTSNNWHITGMQLEIGDVASDFLHEDLYQQKLKCYRYYYQSDGSSAEFKMHGSGTVFQSGNCDVCMDLPVQTRSVPTVGQSNTNIQVGASSFALTGISEVSGTDGGLDKLFLRCGVTGSMTVGNCGILTNNNNAGGKITVSSEM